MKILSFVLAIGFISVLGQGTALAASCNAKANQAAAKRGGEVLSVKSQGNKCKIKLLVKSRNKPPKRVTVVVRK